MVSKGVSRQQSGTGRIDAGGITYNITGNVGSIGNQGTQANVAGEVHGNQTIGNTDTANYAETIQEIQQLLARFVDGETDIIDISEEDSYILAGQAAKEIKADPSFQQRAIAAAKGGALAALKNTAPGKIIAGMIEGWAKAS
ncbi:MAG: hypothetical protein AAFY11_09750 [Cyanobacteria bacterium J06641_5]